jgi:uncharacterized protein
LIEAAFLFSAEAFLSRPDLRQKTEAIHKKRTEGDLSEEKTDAIHKRSAIHMRKIPGRWNRCPRPRAGLLLRPPLLFWISPIEAFELNLVYMALSPELLEILRCPKCKSKVEPKPDNSALKCVDPECALVYPIRDDIPVMLIDEATTDK